MAGEGVGLGWPMPMRMSGRTFSGRFRTARSAASLTLRTKQTPRPRAVAARATFWAAAPASSSDRMSRPCRPMAASALSRSVQMRRMAGESARKLGVTSRTVRTTAGLQMTTIRLTSSLPPIGARVAAHVSSASTSSLTGSAVKARCIRRRRSASRTSTAQLLDRNEVVIQAECPGPEHLQGGRRPHDLRRGDDHHLDPLPVPDRLGRDGLGRLCLQDADQVGDDAQDLTIDPCDQMLVLERQLEANAGWGLDDRVSAGKALCRAAIDVGHLAFEHNPAVAVRGVLQHLDESRERVLVALARLAQAASDPDPQADGPGD